MYPGSPFEMKCRHPEQKLGDCLVSMLGCFVLLFCSYFLASDSFRTTFRSSSSVRYFSHTLVTRLTSAEMVVKSKVCER